MGLLRRDQLLKKEELKKEKVALTTKVVKPAITKVVDGEEIIVEKEVTEIVDYVFVRQMSGREKNTWEISQMKKVGVGRKAQYDVTLEDFRAKLAVVTVCDEDGKLLFAPQDYKQLSENMSAATLEKIVDVAQRLNAIKEEDREEMVKN